jgi:SAM-dependent methyltransferase
VSRLNAKVRCNYYPLPLREAERIRNLLRFPIDLFSALDPCVGDGAAFAAITRDSSARRYGIELDAYRAEQAGPSLAKIVQGNCLETHCAVESFSLCFCNPPYDWALAGNARERLEAVFLNHVFRWLIPGGVLLLVIPAERATDCATDCAQILASHFKCARVFRLSHPESVRYRQVLIAGVRRTRREREQLRDREISECRYRFTTFGREYESLQELADSCDDPYAVPTSGPAALTFKGLPLDELEDLVANSPAYRQTTRILAPEPTVIGGRPLTPLHAGQVGPIRGVADCCCKIFEKRVFSRWRHSIVKMFYRMRLFHLLLAPAQ